MGLEGFLKIENTNRDSVTETAFVSRFKAVVVPMIVANATEKWQLTTEKEVMSRVSPSSFFFLFKWHVSPSFSRGLGRCLSMTGHSSAVEEQLRCTVDVFEAVGPELDASEPTTHHHKDTQSASQL